MALTLLGIWSMAPVSRETPAVMSSSATPEVVELLTTSPSASSVTVDWPSRMVAV
jgi:hypothetical protein